MLRLGSLIRPLPQAGIAAIVVTSVALIGWADYATGTQIRIYPLYFIPLSLAALRMSLAGALGCCASATAAWATANHLAGLTYAHPLIWVINCTSQLLAFVTVVLLVQRLKQLGQREYLLARTDVLTGLANRRGFQEAAARELARQLRYSHDLSLAYFDLDDFKRVNDQLGHSRADQLLAKVGHALRQATRSTDVVARLGGDEFAILYPQTNEAEFGGALARLRQVLREQLAGEPLSVSFSIGGVTFREAPSDVETLVAAADALMYQVKESGKGALLTRVHAARTSLKQDPRRGDRSRQGGAGASERVSSSSASNS